MWGVGKTKYLRPLFSCPLISSRCPDSGVNPEVSLSGMEQAVGEGGMRGSEPHPCSETLWTSGQNSIVPCGLEVPLWGCWERICAPLPLSRPQHGPPAPTTCSPVAIILGPTFGHPRVVFVGADTLSGAGTQQKWSLHSFHHWTFTHAWEHWHDKS